MKFFSTVLNSMKTHPLWWIGGGIVGVYAISSDSTTKKTSTIEEIRSTPFEVKVFKTNLTPLTNFPAYNTHENLSFTSLPVSSPTGFPWLTHNPPMNQNLDSNGEWWMNSGPSWIKVTPSDGSYLDSITRIVTTYVVPALSTMLIGLGPAGVAASSALKAWSILAEGGSVNDALISAARDKLPSGVAQTSFQNALTKARSNLPIEELNKLKSALVSPSQIQAFDQGLVFAAAEKAQESGLKSLKASVPGKEELFDAAMKHGAALADIANAFGGNKGLQFIDDIFKSRTGLNGSPL